MLISWLVFPLVLAVLALGCGLLLERAAGGRLPGALVLPAGLAVIVVAGLFPIMSDPTAELTTPLIVLLAVAGLALSPPWRRGSLDWAAVASAVAVFGVYAAPIVLSGEATLAAYASQIDNATYLGLTDRFMEHGRNLGGLEEGEYRGLLAVLLPEGYPLGSLLPFGVGQKLVGQDASSLLQPYLAFVAAMLSLSLYSLISRVVPSRAVRAAVVFVASQPALLFALAFWAGIKELSAAWVLALLGALLTLVVRDEARGRALLLPLSVAAAATIGMLSFAGAIWIVPLLVAAFALIVRFKSRAFAFAQAAAFLGLTAVLAIPSLALTGEFWKEATAGDVTGESLGALVNSLSSRQLFGVWPAGDFQTTPGAIEVTNVLVGLVLVFAAAGLVWAVRRRAWELALYVGGAATSALAVAVFGSPWIDAKAFAIASPAVVLMALVGALMIPKRHRRIAGALVASAIAAGVVWSNVLAFHDVELAPRDKFRELQRIADRIDGEGPTLLTEYEPYASRHFLRDAGLVGGPSDVYGALIPRPGGGLRLFERTKVVDTEEYGIEGLLHYRTIVRRASALSSRPSSAYRLAWRGRYYEVWQQPAQPEHVINHVALGSGAQPASRPKCSLVRSVARLAGPAGRVATVERRPVTIVSLPGALVWRPESIKSEAAVPDGLRSGSIKGTVTVPATGLYTLWITGSFHRRLELLVDGEPLAEPRDELNAVPGAFYLRIGSRRLAAGFHGVEVRYDDEGAMRPGTGGHAAIAPGGREQPRLLSFGPIALTRDGADPPITRVASSRARDLCGKKLDWLEAVGPQTVVP